MVNLKAVTVEEEVEEEEKNFGVNIKCVRITVYNNINVAHLS